MRKLIKDTEFVAALVVLVAALLAACEGAPGPYDEHGRPAHMVQPRGKTGPGGETRTLAMWDVEPEDGPAPDSVDKSAFTLPDGFGFGVFPPGGHGDPDTITDSACTNAYVHQPVHSVDRCNIPKYKHWTYRVTGASSAEVGYIRDAVDAVNELARYGQGGTNPLTYTTSSSARVRIDLAPYTPEYHREKFVKVRVSDSYLANSQIGPIRRYGKCHVTINTNTVDDPPLDQDPWPRNIIGALAMKGAWQCLGRGTDFYTLTWRCQAHHMTGISPPVTCGVSSLTNADMDNVQPFFDVEMPRQANVTGPGGSSLTGWSSWGDKINLEYLWLFFDPN